MEKIHNEVPDNPYRYVKAEHHYFATNQRRWKVSEDLSKLIEEFRGEEMDYEIWYVPPEMSASYRIDKAIPMVEDAHMIGAFYQDLPPNQF